MFGAVAASEGEVFAGLATTERRIERVAGFGLACEVLDASGQIRRNAQAIATNRREHAHLEPALDPLGSARLWLAALQGDSSADQVAQLDGNVWDEMRKQILEAILPSKHLTPGRARVNAATAETHIGGIGLVTMLARGIHPDNPDWYNRWGELNIVEALLCEELFKDKAHRETHDILTISPLPSDEEPRHRVLYRRGLRPDTGKWMIRLLGYRRAGDHWVLHTEDLSMGGSNKKVQRALFAELGIKLPERPALVRRLGATVLRALRVPRIFRKGDAETTQMLATPVLAERSRLPEGVVGVGMLADSIMADLKGGDYLCGELAETTPAKADYDAIAAQSRKREEDVQTYTEKLVGISKEIVTNSAQDFDEQTRAFKDAFIDTLREMCEENPQYAKHAFGDKAARLYAEVNELRTKGKPRAAEVTLRRAHKESTSTAICGMMVEQSKVKIDFMRQPDLYLLQKLGANGVMRGKCGKCGRFGLVGRDCVPHLCGRCDGKMNH